MNTLRDPALHAYAYYLARAAGDSVQDKAVRRETFLAELNRSLVALGGQALASLPSPERSDRHTRLELYRSGHLPRPDGGAWLFAYQMHDTYLLRLTVYRAGAYPVEDLAALKRDLGWEADGHLAGYLGTSRYYCALAGPAAAQAAATALLGEGRLWPEQTPYGPLYGRSLPAGPFALFYPHTEAEDAANDFFDRIAPELEWYAHKIAGQAREYEHGQRPVLSALEDELRAGGRAARQLYARLLAGDETAGVRLTAQLDHLEALHLDYTTRLEETITIRHGLRLNEGNFRDVLAREGFELDDDGLLQARRLASLGRLGRQLSSDLGFYHPLARQTTELLARLRAGQARLGLPSVSAEAEGIDKPGMEQRCGQRARGLNPHLVIQHPSIPLSEREKDLLRILFAPYTHLALDAEFRAGFGGARAFLALPSRPDGPDAYTVVKLGDAEAILEEANRYDSFVADKLPPITARIQGRPAVLGPQAALRYTFIGGEAGHGRNCSLHEFALTHSAREVADLLEKKLLAIFGPLWWLQRNDYHFLLWEEYDRLLPLHTVLDPTSDDVASSRSLNGESPVEGTFQMGETLRLENFIITEVDSRGWLTLAGHDPAGGPGWRIRLNLPTDELAHYTPQQRLDSTLGTVVEHRRWGLAEGARGAFPNFEPAGEGFEVEGRELPNPLPLLDDLLCQRIFSFRSVIHGDLNLENVLIGPGGLLWLIDFAWVRKGHTLLDFCWLETQFVAHVIAPRFHRAKQGPAAFLPVLDWLENYDLRQTPVLDHEVQTEAATLMAGVRRFGRQCMRDVTNRDEYRLPLLLTYLAALRHGNRLDKMSIAPLPKQLALTAAAVLASYT